MRTPLLCVIFVIACGGSGRTNPDADTDAVSVPIDAVIDGNDIPGEFCGGFTAERCAANEYCDYTEDTCGNADGSGTCKRRPDACPAVVGPVCACDGRVHANDCTAYSDGYDLNANGGCVLPQGSFACGYAVCNLETQYCRRDTKPLAVDPFVCVSLPQGCAAGASCDCLRREDCGATCTGDAKTGLTLSCQ